MSIDPDSFRAVLGRFASGVTVVTTKDESGTDVGMTVSAFSSLSLNPPLILVCIDKSASLHSVFSSLANTSRNESIEPSSANTPSGKSVHTLNPSETESIDDKPYFVVNILAAGQEALARRFADANAKRFDGIGYSRGQRNIAKLDEVLAHLECKFVACHDAGDHSIIVGEVEVAEMRELKPLLYYRSGYAQLER